MTRTSLPDLGGRRLGPDRRQFEYAISIPERRKSGERRSGKGRRLSEQEKIIYPNLPGT
jgi:hypothetical protein